MKPSTPVQQPSMPWWRLKVLWFAWGSLATVMVGSTAMAVVAIRGADTVLVEGQQRITPGNKPDAQTPALLARNHAALGGGSPQAPAKP
jgi:uncharacterized protein